MKRLLSWLLALLVAAGCVSAGEVAAFAAPAYSVAQESLIADAVPSNGEELLEGYVYQLFYGSTTYGRKAGDRLTGNTKILYDALVPIIRQIAAGERTSTVIGIGRSFSAPYIADVEATFSGKDYDLGLLIDALLTDLPYEMYWYDKTASTMSWRVTAPELAHVRIQFPVAENYRGGEESSVDCEKARTAARAAANSAAIVSEYANATDYEKLLGYKEEICDLVEYDYEAAYGGYFSQDNDPWQLIHVFDGDETTKVVCEGYSKAFSYLCQQTAFNGDVTCITVSGNMGGGHMWNIVTLEGQNYLVDVTNSESGTVGYDGSLFLAGGTGSIAEGYTVDGWLYEYARYTGSGKVPSDDVELWGDGPDSILNLASQDYTPPQGVQITEVTVRPDCAGLYYTGSFVISGNPPVSRRGITVSLASRLPVADDSDPLSFWTEGNTSILVTNILDTDENAATNGDRAAKPIYARAYVQLTDGSYIYSDVVSVNLRQVVEAADAQWPTLSSTQKMELTAMYTKFQATLSGWNIPNLKSN